MTCALLGHAVQRFPGIGQFAGREFDVCTRCGRTIDAETGEEMDFSATKRRFQAAMAALERGQWFPSPPRQRDPAVKGRLG